MELIEFGDVVFLNSDFNRPGETQVFAGSTPYCGFLHMGGEEIHTTGRDRVQRRAMEWRLVSAAVG